MPGFKYGYDYERFANRIHFNYRYRIDREGEEFLEEVLKSVAKRKSTLVKGSKVWRAQLGGGEVTTEEEADGSLLIGFPAHPPERMKPLAMSATEGRVNPKGIPVLYVATTPETAMSEVRPSLASVISLAELKVERDVTLVDCTIRSVRSIYAYAGREVPPEEREEVVWHSINEAFTKPVDLSDRIADYAPTQVIAEWMREAGFGGIRYRSGFNAGGDNIALFGLDAATVIDVELMRATELTFRFAAWP